MFQAGDGARRDARPALQILRRDAGQRDAANLQARRLPGLTRDTEHGALTRPGITDDNAEIARASDVRQRVGLLAGEKKSALLGARQSRLPLRILYGMALVLRHQIGSFVQTLFGLDHLLRSEAILAAPILAQLHEIGHTAHRTHHLVELLDAVAVAVCKARHVASGEGRLLMGDGVQCQ